MVIIRNDKYCVYLRFIIKLSTDRNSHNLKN